MVDPDVFSMGSRTAIITGKNITDKTRAAELSCPGNAIKIKEKLI